MCGVIASTSPAFCDGEPWAHGMTVIECRGPDSEGDVCLSSIRFGHRRLEIIGLGLPGRQPVVDEMGDCLVYNGEIYNYRELAAEIGVQADSDTHLLYELLRRGDLGRLRRLRGMYAFVFWSSERSELLTARDPFGIKPLYLLRHADGEVSFASVASALAGSPDRGELDDSAIAGFLAGGMFPVGVSPFSRILKMKPGVLLRWMKQVDGWQATPLSLSSDAWPQMDVESALVDSLDAHLVSDVPVGVLLSGGLDSCLLTALAVARNPRLRTFSLTTPASPAINEGSLAQSNAAKLGTHHLEVPVGPSDLAAQIMPIVRTSGEPFSDPAYLALSCLCAVAAEHVKVVLAGEGADELFAGYRRYQVQRLRDSLVLGRGAGMIARLSGAARAYRTSAPTQRVRTLASWERGRGVEANYYLIYGEWDALGTTIPSATTAALNLARENWAAMESTPGVIGRPAYQSFDLTQWMPNVFLEKSDRASMLHGLEIRVPYLDPVLASAAGRYSPRGTQKAPLRELLYRLHPDVKLPRTKMGLSIDTAGVVAQPSVSTRVTRQLYDSKSALRRIGAHETGLLARRARLNPNFALRLATLDAWEEAWSA